MAIQTDFLYFAEANTQQLGGLSSRRDGGRRKKERKASFDCPMTSIRSISTISATRTLRSPPRREFPPKFCVPRQKWVNVTNDVNAGNA